LTVEDMKSLHITYYRFFVQQWKENTLHVIIETGLFGFIVWLMFFKKTSSDKSVRPKITDAGHEERKRDYNETKKPLAPKYDDLTPHQKNILKNIVTITSMGTGKTGKYYNVRIKNENDTDVEVKDVLNMSSFDFYGMGCDQEVKDVARRNLEKYGCGSCGPRGFYGTIDQHMEFEEKIASFMNENKNYGYEAISYSDGASSVTSAIPAFSKKGDLLVIDEACNESVFAGAKLSKSDLVYFKHNDMDDLKNQLDKIRSDDKKKNRDSTQQRRFIIVEGIYRNTGQICKLDELKKIKDEFKYRVILDETLSFGTLGKTGRGITEEYNIPLDNFEIVNIAMDTAIGSIGGVCIGNREVVDHQRLSGAGYCFSASAPPFLSACAIKSIELIESNKNGMVVRLKENAKILSDKLAQIQKDLSGSKNGYSLVRISENKKTDSAVQFLALKCPDSVTRHDKESFLYRLEKACIINGLGVSTCKYAFSKPEKLDLALRFTVSSLLDKADLDKIPKIVTDSFKQASN
jgi:serine palmitoyltransferase